MIPFFIYLRWLDALDILLVAFLIYQLYQLAKGTVAIKIFVGILSIYILWKLVKFLQMDMLGEILGQFIGVGVIALLIVFQQELRRFLLMIGNTRLLSGDKREGFFKRYFTKKEPTTVDIETITSACKRMTTTRSGALIVIAKTSDPVVHTLSGVEIDSIVSDKLLENIFFKNSPLHDGAVVINGNRITHARCVLPVSKNPDFPDEFGTRHRAACGLSETCDAIVVVVSEQTGLIAIAREGKIKTKINPEDLIYWLKKML